MRLPIKRIQDKLKRVFNSLPVEFEINEAFTNIFTLRYKMTGSNGTEVTDYILFNTERELFKKIKNEFKYFDAAQRMYYYVVDRESDLVSPPIKELLEDFEEIEEIHIIALQRLEKMEKKEEIKKAELNKENIQKSINSYYVN